MPAPNLSDPTVLRLPGAFAAEMCREIVAAWPPDRLAPSLVRTVQGLKRGDYRTSSQAVCDEPPELIDYVRRVIAAVTRLPETHQEPLAIVRYGPGEYFRLHHDQPIDPVIRQTFASNGGPRVASVTIQLTADCTGGELSFPDIGQVIAPAAGELLCWGDHRDLGHEVLPVTSGERYCLVTFVRERPYVPSELFGW